MAKTPVQNRCLRIQPAAEKLWNEALGIIADAPSSNCGMDFDEKVFLLFSLLGIEINDRSMNCAYHSALAAESLQWLLDRIQWASSRSA